MITFEYVNVEGFGPSVRGARNPMNSWDRSDSGNCGTFKHCNDCPALENKARCVDMMNNPREFAIGPKDHDLLMRLREAGSDHRKYERMIVVWVDITAPLYWWKEFDTYKVGTVSNSCSTMHKIHERPLTVKDFSTEHLTQESMNILMHLISHINQMRNIYVDSKREEKEAWWQMIQLLPTSYNQRRTIMLSYENLVNIYNARKNHRLDEWRNFCRWIEDLPYSELITGETCEKTDN